MMLKSTIQRQPSQTCLHLRDFDALHHREEDYSQHNHREYLLSVASVVGGQQDRGVRETEVDNLHYLFLANGWLPGNNEGCP